MSRLDAIYPRDRVSLREVGLRDGLQLTTAFPSTEAKRDWLARESAAGIRHFEIGSFLPVKSAPQFADLREVIAICRELGVHSSALALNERGSVDAVGSGVDEIVCVVSATEDHSQANMRRSIGDAVELVRKTVRLAAESGHRPVVYAGVAMAFGCSISGDVRERDVVRIARDCARAGADVIGLADTVGYAGPDQIASLCRQVAPVIGDARLGIHLHDTRGMGLANAAAALDAGVRIVDASLGGLGGCPFAPGATGNIVMEDLVFLCERKGFGTGIDLDRLVAVREVPAAEMPDEQLYGAMARAGAPKLAWRSATN